MKPGTKFLLGAGVLILLGAFTVSFLRPQRTATADAIKVLGLVGKPKPEPGTNLWRLTVAISNTTAKTLEITFPNLEVRGADVWEKAAEALDPGANYASEIRPHACAMQDILFPTKLPEREWRLQFNVLERVSGFNKVLWAKRMKLSVYDGINPNKTIWALRGEVVSPVFGANAGTNRSAEVHN